MYMEKPFGEMVFGKKSFGRKSFGKMIFDEMSDNPTDNLRNTICKKIALIYGISDPLQNILNVVIYFIRFYPEAHYPELE